MEKFKELAKIILSIKIETSFHEEKYYYFVSEPIVDEIWSGSLAELRNDAIIELLSENIDSSIRQVSRLKRIIKKLYDLQEDVSFKNNEDDLFEQIQATSSTWGFLIDNSKCNAVRNNPIVTFNFIEEIENELWARLFIIDRLEDAVLESEPETFSIYTEGEFVIKNGLPPLRENELPYVKWTSISKRETGKTKNLKSTNGIRMINSIEGLFYDQYSEETDTFLNILKNEGEIPCKPSDLPKMIVNAKNEWIGKSSRLAYIFYDCLLREGIVSKVRTIQDLTKLFTNKFAGLSTSFATTGIENLSNPEKEYKKYFIEEIRKLKPEKT